MAEYQLTATDVVIRTVDNASIPNDPANRDRQEYNAWYAAGGVPDPYVPPEPVPPVPTVGQQVLYDHEVRICTIEGVPPPTIEGFVARLMGG
jgi:hypothetical protein